MFQPLKKFETLVYRRLGRVPPQGKLHRTAFWLLILYLLLGVGRLVPNGGGQTIAALSFFALCALIVCCVPLFWRWVVRRLMWRVSNRLVVTYLLIGLTPVVLFVTLALVAAYVFSGQFATFAAHSEIERELAEIGAENRAFSVHIAKEIKESPRPKTITVPEFDDDSASAGHSKMEVAAFLDGQPLALETKPPMRPGMPGIPPWLKDSFRGVVMGHGTCFLRAADTQIVDGHKLILVTSLPLEKENLDEIASGLGTVTLVPGLGPEEDEVDASQLDKGLVKQLGSQSHEKGGPPPPPPARFRVGRVNPTPGQGPVHLQINGRNVADMPGHPGAVSGGQLAPKAHFFDVTVSFVSPLQAVFWRTGEAHQALIQVNSRPSLLYQRLFITSLQVAGIIQDMLIGVAVFFAVLELIAFIMAVRLNQTITNSVSDLYVATQEIDKGNLSHRIAVKRQDQLAALVDLVQRDDRFA